MCMLPNLGQPTCQASQASLVGQAIWAHRTSWLEHLAKASKPMMKIQPAWPGQRSRRGPQGRPARTSHGKERRKIQLMETAKPCDRATATRGHEQSRPWARKIETIKETLGKDRNKKQCTTRRSRSKECKDQLNRQQARRNGRAKSQGLLRHGVQLHVRAVNARLSCLHVWLTSAVRSAASRLRQ